MIGGNLLKKIWFIFNDKVLIGLAYLAGIVILATSLAISYNVVLRYFFQSPVGWVNEVSEYALFFSTFLGAAWVLKQDGHVKIDILLMYLPERAKRWVNLINILLSVFICSLVVYYSFGLVVQEYITGIVTIGILIFKRWWMLSIIPISFAFMLLILLRNFHHKLFSISLQENVVQPEHNDK